jgi:hypothetical protein
MDLHVMESHFEIDSKLIGATDLLGFQKIKHLHLPFRFVTGCSGDNIYQSDSAPPDMYKLFPPSIRSLSFDVWETASYEKNNSAFAKVLQQEDATPPNLQSVHIFYHVPDIPRNTSFAYTLPPQGKDVYKAPKSPFPMDFPLLSQLSQGSNVRFTYTLFLDRHLGDVVNIEMARAQILCYPHGEELIKHLTCGEGERVKGLLSRDVHALSPFVFDSDFFYALLRTWLGDEFSDEDVAEEVKHYQSRVGR